MASPLLPDLRSARPNPEAHDLPAGKIAWRERGPGGGSAAAAEWTPIRRRRARAGARARKASIRRSSDGPCADGRVYFHHDDGVVALLEATPAAYRLKGKFSTPRGSGPAWPHPVIAGGKLYLRWADILLCYDIAAR